MHCNCVYDPCMTWSKIYARDDQKCLTQLYMFNYSRNEEELTQQILGSYTLYYLDLFKQLVLSIPESNNNFTSSCKYNVPSVPKSTA